MPSEPFSYRARKWAVQEASTRLSRPTQHQRLNETDWDITVVLDACRWNVLQSVTHWPLDAARSPGSSTAEWLAAAADSSIFEGANVASGNVKYSLTDVGANDIAPVWETDWDVELGTVLPEPVLDRADKFLRAEDRPVVAHVLPPHAPYVAHVGGRWLPAFPETDAWDQNPDGGDRVSAQVALATGRVDLNRAEQAYRASVASTWEVVSTYVGEWVDRGHDVVVTADHGEAFGGFADRFLYGHPNRCHVDALVRVPFERFSAGTEPAVDAESLGVEEKLQALGYVE